jgi:hypothetical protein
VSFFKKDKDGNSASGPQDVASQLTKIIEHLSFLEKKLDTLLESSRGRQPMGGRSFGGHSGGPNRGFRRPGQGSGNYRPGPREVFNSSRPSRPSRPGGHGGPGGRDHRGPRRPYNPNAGSGRPPYRPENRPEPAASEGQEQSFNA